MNERTNELAGRVVLITGAGRGIGAGIARVAAYAGATVAINALTSSYVDDLARDLSQQSGQQVIPIVGDVTTPSGAQRVVASTIERLGYVDALVNTVGDSLKRPLVDLPGEPGSGLSDEEVQSQLELNLMATICTTRAIGPHLLSRGSGHVINISSASATRRNPNATIYVAAKSAVIAFTRALAYEWAPFGIHVNGVAPGTCPDAIAFGDRFDAVRADIAARVPLGRAGEIDEIGEVVRFLLTSAADYMIGQTLIVDGGASI